MFDQQHDDEQIGPAQPIPEVPPLKTYKIRLYHLAATRKDAEVITIQGHEVVTNAAGMGNMFRVMEYVLHPNLGPSQRVALSIFKPADAWLEYEEVLPVPVEASRILSPHTSGPVM